MVRARHAICLVVSVPSPAGPPRMCCGVVMFGGGGQSKKGEQVERRDKNDGVENNVQRRSG